MEHEPIISDELIGRMVTIIESTDPSWINLSGIIIDETKHTFLIEIEKKQRHDVQMMNVFISKRNQRENNRGKIK